MKTFIFFTAEGRTLAPPMGTYQYEHEVENCQVLGTARGMTVGSAWKNLKKEDRWIRQNGFGKENIFAHEIVSDEQLTVVY